MVMLFTEEQHSLNKAHDDAWADIYHRFSDLPHDEKRVLFLSMHPQASPDFIYPTRVDSKTHPERTDHRRHVKIPDDADDAIVRFLGDSDHTFGCIFKKFIQNYHVLTVDNIKDIQACQDQLIILSSRLRKCPPFDAEFEELPHSHPIADENTAILIANYASEAPPTPDQPIFVEGVQNGVSGMYRIFHSTLPYELADKADVLVEFIDEAILLIEKTGKVYIERDKSI